MITPADTAARFAYLTHRVDQLETAVQDRDEEIARLNTECAALRWRLRLADLERTTARAARILGRGLQGYKDGRT